MVKKRLGKITYILILGMSLSLLLFSVSLSAQVPSVTEPSDTAQEVVATDMPDVPPPDAGGVPDTPPPSDVSTSPEEGTADTEEHVVPYSSSAAENYAT